MEASFPPVMEIRSICLMSEAWITDRDCSGVFEKVAASFREEESSNWQAVSVRNKNVRRKKKREKFLKTPADSFCMEDQSFRIMREKYQCQLRFLGMSKIFPRSADSGKESADYFREGVHIESAFLHTDHRGQDSVQISVWLKMSAAWSEVEALHRTPDISKSDDAGHPRNITGQH